jgi:hypothetical protein
MGCGASIPNWQAELTTQWPRFLILRTQHAFGEHSLQVLPPGGEGAAPLLALRVVPYKNSHGHVSVVSVHPFSVEFSNIANAGLSYEKGEGNSRSLRCAALGSVATYARRIAKRRPGGGNADTEWRSPRRSGAAEAMAVQSGAIALPGEITVVNVSQRVAVWRGARPSDAQDAYRRGARDLLAQVQNASRGALSPDGSTETFELAVRPELVEAASAAGAPVLALFLAIAIEGFWAQGAADFASMADIGVIAPSIAQGADVRPNMNMIDSIRSGAKALK